MTRRPQAAAAVTMPRAHDATESRLPLSLGPDAAPARRIGHGRRRIVALVALSTLVGGLMPTTAQAAPDPETCTGYPERRAFVESQDWWSPIPALGGMGHIHMGMCWPIGRIVGGRVRFDVKVTFHHNKGRLILIKLQDDRSVTLRKVKPNYSPPVGGTATYWKTFFVDTRLVPDGVRMFRWYARIRHGNGNEETARAGWPLNVENGKLDRNGTAWGQYQGSGWYKQARSGLDWGYQTAFITGGIPVNPVGGVWRPRVKFSCNGCNRVSSWFATVDPNFHAGDRGWTVRNGKGGGWGGNLAIDTRRLSNGPHRLVLVSSSRRINPVRRHSGVLVVPFTVRN
jgi:hypothetical protein